MSRLLARLAKLESAIPLPQIEQAPTSTLKLSLAEIVAKSKADAAFLETATPLQRYSFHKAAVKRHEAALAEAQKPTDNALRNTLSKVRKMAIPRFIESSRQELHLAELDILREAGFTNHLEPGAQRCLDDITFDA